MDRPRRTEPETDKCEEKYNERPAPTHMFSNVKLANLYYKGTDPDGAEWYRYVLTGSAFFPIYKDLIYEVRPQENRMYLKTFTGDLIFQTRNDTRAGSEPMEWMSDGKEVFGGVDSNLIFQKNPIITLESNEVLSDGQYTRKYVIAKDTSKHFARAFINVGKLLTTVSFEDCNLGVTSKALLLAMSLIKHREINYSYLPTISTHPFTYTSPSELTKDILDKRFQLLNNVNDIYIKKTSVICHTSLDRNQYFAVANSKNNQLIYTIDAKLGGATATSAIRLFQSGLEHPLLVVDHLENIDKGGCAARVELEYDIGYIGAWAITSSIDSNPEMKVYNYDQSLQDKHFAISALYVGPKMHSRHVCYVSWEQTGLLTRVRFLEDLPPGHKLLILVWAMSVTYRLLKSDLVSVPRANDVATIMYYTQQALATTHVLQDRTLPNAQELGRLSKLNSVTRMSIKMLGRTEGVLSVDYYCVKDVNTGRSLFLIDSRPKTGYNSFVTDPDTNLTIGSIGAFGESEGASYIHLNRECSIAYISKWDIYDVRYSVRMFFVKNFIRSKYAKKNTSFTIFRVREKDKLADIVWDENAHLTVVYFYKYIDSTKKFIIMLYALKVQYHVQQTLKTAVPCISGVNEALGILGIRIPETEVDNAMSTEVSEEANFEPRTPTKQRMRIDTQSNTRTMMGILVPTCTNTDSESELNIATTGFVSKPILDTSILVKPAVHDQPCVNPQPTASMQQPGSYQRTLVTQRSESPVIATPSGRETWPTFPSLYGVSTVGEKNSLPQQTNRLARDRETSEQRMLTDVEADLRSMTIESDSTLAGTPGEQADLKGTSIEYGRMIRGRVFNNS